ncbi:hypothetical protein LSAT2_005588, partial [Lamellibrachia satsuma]
VDSWSKSQFPNPQLDVDDCGNNGSKSSVCDPFRVLTRREVDTLDKQIRMLRENEACDGWVASIAIVPRIRLNDCMYPSTDAEELDATKDFADHLLKSWKSGDCRNNLVIVVSHTDRNVSDTFAFLQWKLNIT